MFRLLGNVAQIAVDTVTLPIAAVADVVTLGGELAGREEPYSVSRMKSIGENAEQIFTPEADDRF